MTSETPRTHNRGFIRYIVILIIFAAILAYFGITATDIVESGPAQFLIGVWQEYGAPTAGWIWDNIVIGFIWKYAVIFFENVF